MPLTLAPTCLVDSTAISKYIFNVDDIALGGSLTAQQLFALELTANAASEQVQRYCGYTFKQGSYTEVWDGAASDELIPREIPVTAITSIKFAFNGDFASATPIDPTAYCIGSRGMVINFRNDAVMPRGRGLIQVVYQAGYTTVPYDLQLATLRQLQYLYRQIGKGDSMLGLKSVSKSLAGNSENQTKDDNLGKSGLLAEVEGMLRSYTRFESPNSIMFTRVS